MEQPATYSIALALQDFLPVALSSIGLFYLAELAALVARGKGIIRWLALAGAWITMLGGGIKAAWKLNLAVTGNNIGWMDNQLFFLLGAGFTLLAWSFITARRYAAGKKVQSYSWLVPLIIIAVFYVAGFYVRSAYPNVRWWIFILLGLTTIANFTLSGTSIRQAFEQRQIHVAIFFILNIVCIIALQGLTRTGNRAESMQWIEQTINTFSNGAFAYAAWALNRKFKA
jgi:hypothetical protein